MKTPLGIFFAVLAFFTLAPAAFARDTETSFSLNINAGEPVYYSTAPAYYTVHEEPYWWNTPVRVVYFNGRPHRMHYWRGRWYDEAWSSRYRTNRYDRYHHDHNWSNDHRGHRY